MKNKFLNRKVSRTYCILWTFLLYAVCSIGITNGCPAGCSCDLETCKNVDCWRRGLKGVPTGIPNDTCILNLYGNQISKIDSNAFQGLSQLQTLTLWGNKISTIDSNAFDGLSQLQTLDLDGNQISRIDRNAFQGLSQLETLDLRSNQISWIDRNAFQGLSQLKTLYLFNNNITFLNKEMFMALPNLTNLYIGGNPFDCTCDLEPFTVFMKTKGMLPYNLSWTEEPKCNSPSRLSGEQIIDVPFHNMSCSTTIETTISIRKTTDYKSTKQTVYSTPFDTKNDQHTSGNFLSDK